LTNNQYFESIFLTTQFQEYMIGLKSMVFI